MPVHVCTINAVYLADHRQVAFVVDRAETYIYRQLGKIRLNLIHSGERRRRSREFYDPKARI
jgi:hypothetical protein